MTLLEKEKLIEYRLNKLSGSEKNIKSPGVVKKLRRELRKIREAI